jgi:hypothetical protein
VGVTNPPKFALSRLRLTVATVNEEPVLPVLELLFTTIGFTGKKADRSSSSSELVELVVGESTGAIGIKLKEVFRPLTVVLVVLELEPVCMGATGISDTELLRVGLVVGGSLVGPGIRVMDPGLIVPVVPVPVVPVPVGFRGTTGRRVVEPVLLLELVLLGEGVVGLVVVVATTGEEMKGARLLRAGVVPKARVI